MKFQDKGAFIISLDFELMWGVRDKRTIESYGKNIGGVRKVIPALLDLFTKYDIHATFATVGFLFCRNKSELLKSLPSVLPDYKKPLYSPFEQDYLNTIGNSEEDDIYHYAQSLIKLIQQFPQQEVATHTFSHYYCLEGASLKSFEEDLLAAIKIAKRNNIYISSIVFPRNQYSKKHIEICQKLGILSFRGNENSSIYKTRKNEDLNKFVRILKFADTYINLTGHNTFSINYNNNGIIDIPSSRFLRPYTPKLKSFETLKLKRIKSCLTYAAKNNQSYHLWWHPHNFGIYIQENLQSLEEILKHFKLLQEEYGMLSRNMREIAEEKI